MRYGFAYDHQMDARIFRLILNDYLICRERQLSSALVELEQEIARWLNRVGSLLGEW